MKPAHFLFLCIKQAHDVCRWKCLHIFCFYVYNKHMKPAHFLFLCIQQAHDVCRWKCLHIFCFYVYNKYMKHAGGSVCTFSVAVYTISTMSAGGNIKPACGSVCTFSVFMPAVRYDFPLSVNSLVGQGCSNWRVEGAAAGAPRHQ